MTVGTIMFYSGIGLFGAAFIGLIISDIVLAAKGRKLRDLMHDRYGD